MRIEPRARIGEVLDEKYRIEEFLGGGAMGNVFRVRHLKVGKSFAIKVLHSRLRTDPKIAMRFQREAEVAAKLRHPNVVGVLDVNEVAGEAYMVMEYAPGHTLAELIRASAPFPRERAIAIIRQLLDGLEHAHGAGLIHRDLKPDNVIVEHTSEREIARIVDFGIAILRENAESADRDRGRITTDGLVLGTPQYMAPELATGKGFDHRADLFALGVICFEMLTGQMPFDGTGVEVALANVGTNTPAMGVRVPQVQVDPMLELFTRRLMMKNPADRFANAADARAALELIETDPHAAAEQLATVAAIHPRGSGPHSNGLRAKGSVAPANKPITAEERLEIGSAQTQAITTVERPKLRLRSRLVLIAGMTAGALALAAVTVGGRWHKQRTTASQPHVATAKPEVVTMAPSPQPVAPPAATPVFEAPPIAATRAPVTIPVKPKATKQVKKPQPAIAIAPAPVPGEVTANDVAARYAAVGRKLKAKANQPGVDEVWARYRTIRIQTQLATPEDRERTSRLLLELNAALDKL